MLWRRLVCLLPCLALLAVWPSAAAAAGQLQTGFVDGVYAASSPSLRAVWYDRTRDLGADIVRIGLNWNAVAPRVRPPGFRATDPADPAYRWGAIDAAVRDAHARGLAVLLTIGYAPRWAEGPGGGSVGAGTWRPDPAAYGDFARAAAARYSGSHPDPLGGRLPRVSRWQMWNEPNLETHLRPQRVRQGRGWRNVSASHYRKLLNAGYAGVKAVRRSNLVVTAGTAPFGDRTGRRTPPVLFVRDLLCLRGARLRPASCPNPARFDVLSHHPYGVGSPYQRAYSPLDVTVGELGKLRRVLRAAERRRRALPRRRKRLWVTEISWDSSPPDPDGVPAGEHARWLADSFYLLWRAGVDTITWFQIRDAPAGGDFSSTSQSGVFLLDGRAKPAARAFRFPFVATRRRDRVVLWGRAPSRGVVAVQRRRGRRWVAVRRLRTGRSRVFSGSVRLRGGGPLRARVGRATSLSRRPR